MILQSFGLDSAHPLAGKMFIKGHLRKIRSWDLHVKWKKEKKLMATPTILINGYELPDVYKIEDLIFFKDLRIEM